VLPDLFKIKVKKWLGNNEETFKEIYNQVRSQLQEQITMASISITEG